MGPFYIIYCAMIITKHAIIGMIYGGVVPTVVIFTINGGINYRLIILKVIQAGQMLC